MGSKPSSGFSRISFLHRLASVEVHYILQFLDMPSKLHTARCCSKLLADAANSFAWGEHDYVSAGLATDDHIMRLRHTRLLRHAPLLLHWNSSANDAHFTDFGLHVRCLQVQSIRGDFHADQLNNLLQHSNCFGDLQMLRFDTDPFTDAALAKTIVALPHLCSLEMHSMSSHRSSRSFADAPSLTELRILSVGHMKESERHLCDALLRCTHLRKVHFSSFEQHEDLFQRIFASHNMHQLRHLSLHRFDSAHVERHELDAVFAALTRLHTLHLRRIHRIDRLLPHLPGATSLTDVTIECGAWEGQQHWNPTKEQLQMLQQSLQQLHTTLLVVPLVEDWLYDFVEQYEFTEFGSDVLRDELTARWKWLRKKAVRISRVHVVPLHSGEASQ
jgi:hypothetical protein